MGVTTEAYKYPMPVAVYMTQSDLITYYKAFTCTWELRDDAVREDMADAIRTARKLNCPSFFGLYLAVPVNFIGGVHGNA